MTVGPLTYSFLGGTFGFHSIDVHVDVASSSRDGGFRWRRCGGSGFRSGSGFPTSFRFDDGGGGGGRSRLDRGGREFVLHGFTGWTRRGPGGDGRYAFPPLDDRLLHGDRTRHAVEFMVKAFEEPSGVSLRQARRRRPPLHSPHALHWGRPSSSRLHKGVVLVPQFRQLIPIGTAPLAGLTRGRVVIPA
jgi:hypothetical protein